jgi:hypothetical protein
MKTLVKIATVAAMLSSIGASAHAAVTTFDDVTAFLAATTVKASDGFEVAPFNTQKSYDAYDGDGFTIASTGKVAFMDQQFNAWSDWGSGDTGILSYNAPLTITFEAPVYAFGVDLMTYPYGRKVEVSSDGYSGEVITGNKPNRTFFGFTSTEGFTTVTLHSHQGYLLYDNLVYGDLAATSPAPEPATWAMMILGFGGVGAMLRKGRGRPAVGGALVV